MMTMESDILLLGVQLYHTEIGGLTFGEIIK